MADRSDMWRPVGRRWTRAGFSLGAGILIGLLAAFGVVAPVFQRDPVVVVARADDLADRGEMRLLEGRYDCRRGLDRMDLMVDMIALQAAG